MVGLAFGWCSVHFLGLCSCWDFWLLGHSVGGLFDCTQGNKLGSSLKGVNDGFDCCAGVLIILLFSFFLFVLKTVVL